MPACGWGCWPWRGSSGSACGRTGAVGPRPIAFGVGWFLVALLPTALTPLAEVANDHRMFFPFVGLTLAMVWGAWLLMTHAEAPVLRRWAVPLIVAVLVAESIGVSARNRVWHSDESLWHDVTVKSPTNGRGLMNYGLTLMARGDYPGAIGYFERALVFTPDYPLLHVNLGIAYGGAQARRRGRAGLPARADAGSRRLADALLPGALARRQRPHGGGGVRGRPGGRTQRRRRRIVGAARPLEGVQRRHRRQRGGRRSRRGSRWHRFERGSSARPWPARRRRCGCAPTTPSRGTTPPPRTSPWASTTRASSLPRRRCVSTRAADCPQQLAYAVEQKARRAAAGNPPRG